MLELLAKIGLASAQTTFSTWWYFDETECPESLLD